MNKVLSMKKFLMFALLAASVISSNSNAASYVIQPGDTLEGVAHKFGVSYDDLMKANSGINPEYVRNGLTYGFEIEIPERKVVQNQRATITIVNPVPKHHPQVYQDKNATYIVNPVPKKPQPQPKHHTTPTGPTITIVEEDTGY